MWTTVVGGIFALAGAALGVLLEPLKGLLSSRTRTRQLRGERCAEILRAAGVIQQEALTLNADYRARLAGQRAAVSEQLTAMIRGINQAKTDLRLATSLLRLHGPDELAAKAGEIVDADDALFHLIQTPDVGPHVLAVPPPQVQQASKSLEDAAREFAQVARRWTR